MKSVKIDQFANEISWSVGSIDDMAAHAGKSKVGRVKSNVSDLISQSRKLDL